MRQGYLAIYIDFYHKMCYYNSNKKLYIHNQKKQIMEPKEQTFDFSVDTLNENIAQWIYAVAKIPLRNMKIFTFPEVIEKFSEMYSMPLDKEPHLGPVSITVKGNGAEIVEGYFEPRGEVVDPEKDCFGVSIYPDDKDDQIDFYFERDDRSRLDPPTKEFAALVDRAKLQPALDVKWQESYDALCRIARYEQMGIPPAPGDEAREKFLDTPFSNMALSLRLSNCLKALYVNTPRELSGHSAEDFRKFRNFGRKSMKELKELMATNGIQFN